MSEAPLCWWPEKASAAERESDLVGWGVPEITGFMTVAVLERVAQSWWGLGHQVTAELVVLF